MKDSVPESTLWEENKPPANRLHPTMKPVELVERALMNSSKSGDIVVDLFGDLEQRRLVASVAAGDPSYWN
jgi:DNA modification methylase